MNSRETFDKELERYTAEAEETVRTFLLPVNETPERMLTVMKAMEYALLAGGKRLRPVLMRLSFELFGGKKTDLLSPFMAAIEMIHTYSLVHDDLPSMDNDTMRRGKETVHVVYGEAMAVLAGDGLLNLAYETAMRATEACENGEELLRVVMALRILAYKAGIFGMVGGQCEDIEAESKKPKDPEATLAFIHECKTAALFEAALMCGAILADAPEEHIDRMELAGSFLGRCFQISDDLLDETGDPEVLGKTTGKDREQGKLTWTGLYGIPRAKEDAARFLEEAVSLFKACGAAEDDVLVLLTRRLLSRSK